MNELKTLQKQFMASIYEHNTSIERSIETNGISADKRMEIYYNNVIGAIVNALQDTFDTVYKLVGDEFFRFAVRQYIKTEQPSSGDLGEFGASFPQFLGQFPPCKKLPYLEDIATLNWYRHLAYGAKDEPQYTVENTSTLIKNSIENLILITHSSSKLLTSTHPLDVIFSVCHDNEHDTDTIELPQRGCRLLIYRKGYHLTHLVLSEPEYFFLESIIQNNTIGEAVETIDESLLDQLDLGNFLLSLFEQGVITKTHKVQL
jgi:hypothetical protein